MAKAWAAAAALATVYFFGASAQAHVGHGADSLMRGFLHPWGGLDHLAAMVAVGWAGAVSLRSWKRLALPLGFVAALALGALWAWNAPVRGTVEFGVIASLFALAGVLALGLRAPLWGGVLVSLAAGFAHGLAHGAELPVGAEAGEFLLGFVASSASLHAAGAIGALAVARVLASRERYARYIGAALLAMLGAVLLPM
jgi:urease accessory protein